MKGNRKIAVVLTAIVLCVWGTVCFKIYAAVAAPDEEPVRPTSVFRERKTKPAEPYRYLENTRDPFRFLVPRHVDSTKKQIAAKPLPPPWTPPPFKLGGVVVSARKRTAMIERGDGTVFFLNEGDTISGVRVLRISDTVVTYYFSRKKSEWSVSHQ